MMLLGNPCGGTPNSQGKTKQPEVSRIKRGSWGEETAWAEADVRPVVDRVIAEPAGGAAVLGIVDPGAAAQQSPDDPGLWNATTKRTLPAECGLTGWAASRRGNTRAALEEGRRALVDPP
jgi:hypothetical protein